MARFKTLDQVERMKAKAARFVRDVLNDEERAAEIEDESPEDYAARKQIEILKPPRKTTIKRRTIVATVSTTPTKADLESILDDVQDILEDAYTPEASREELAEAIGKALDILGGEDEDSDSEDSDEDDGPED